MHRCDPWRVVILIAVALVLVSPSGAIAQEGPRQKRPRRPASGNRVDIGDGTLSVSCAGTGSPTVVLEAGGGNAADTWASVQPEVARFTRLQLRPGWTWPERSRPEWGADRPGQRRRSPRATRRRGYLRPDRPGRSFVRRFDHAALCQPISRRRGRCRTRRWHAARPTGVRPCAVTG